MIEMNGECLLEGDKWYRGIHSGVIKILGETALQGLMIEMGS